MRKNYDEYFFHIERIMSEILKKLREDIHFIEGLNSCMN